jgi:hypothetical protein
MAIYGSSQTNKNYANYQGSQTYAPKSVVKAPSQPYIGTKAVSTSGGSNPNSNSSGGSTFSQDYMKAYNDDIAAFNKSVDDYTNEVIAQSQGDLDFASKWIENTFTEAMGKDDVQRAQFLKKVANALEAKVGTIAYDHDRDTYRVSTDRDLALQRLDYDEQRIKVQNQQDREAQGANLNQRGILSSTREGATGLAGKEVAMLEGGIGERMESLRRNRENINIGSERDLADITTGARRNAIAATDTRNSQIEQAKRLKEKNDALARANASAQKASNESYLKNQYFG